MMRMRQRRGWPLAMALTLLAGPAGALDERAATRFLFAQNADGVLGRLEGCTAFARWGAESDGLHAVATPGRSEVLSVALMRAGPDGAPRIVAGPTGFEPIATEHLLDCRLDFLAHPPLGGRPVVALRVRNVSAIRGRATVTEALHLLMRDGAELRLVFGAVISGTHSEPAPGGRRAGWQIRHELVPLPARPGAMPDLELRDARTRRAVSRHRWQGGRYEPPAYDRFPLPRVGPG